MRARGHSSTTECRIADSLMVREYARILMSLLQSASLPLSLASSSVYRVPVGSQDQ